MNNQQQRFNNPILAGYHPDPSICRVGSDYYLVNSTFGYFPGIPVFHSKDLVNWKLIGHVLDRREQLNLDGFRLSDAIWAPTIRYYNKTFYVTCTVVDGENNFVVTSDKPEGPWTNPVWLPAVKGIDPSLFFDDDGSAYITYNSDPDENPQYDGHKTIRIIKFDPVNLKTTGENNILINGGVDISKNPIWIEGPHLYKKDDYYYLSCAEGGTADGHSQVIFKSKKVDGPYIPYKGNPILTQRHLNVNRKFPITSTGHADFIQTTEGDWWALFLGCRPYPPFEEGHYNTGRETFLAPVEWKDGWPLINPGYDEVQYSYHLPVKTSSEKVDIPYNGNFTHTDNFDQPELHPSWFFLRTPRTKWYKLENSYLTIQLRPENVTDLVNPSFIARRQQHSKGYAIVSMNFTAKSENEKAGLVIFQDEVHFYYICKSIEGDNEIIQLYKPASDSFSHGMNLIVSQKLEDELKGKELLLKIETCGRHFNFYYGADKSSLKLLKDKVDATFLSIRTTWGFVGNVYAMYATSLGKETINTASYDWFEYNGDDDVYKISNS